MSNSVGIGTVSADMTLNIGDVSKNGNTVKEALKEVSAVMQKETAAVKASMAEMSSAMKSAGSQIKMALTGVSESAEATGTKTEAAATKMAAGVEGAGARVSKAASKISKDLKQVGDNHAALDRLANQAGVAGATIAAGLGAAAKTAADFDQALRNVDSIAHLSETEFRKLHESVMALADDPNIRQSPQDLAKGLYDIYSSGFQGAQALDILKVSAEGASAGMTDSATASKTLMAVLNSGIGGVTSARQAMDVLFQEVNYGVNTFEELATSIGTSLPIAAKAGITLQELTAAIGVMTRQGISASESITELQQFILHLINPGHQAAEEMDKLGIKHGLAAVQAEGLSGAIQNVITKTNGQGDSLSKLFPRVESFIGFLAIAKNGGKDFADALDQETHAGDGVGQMMEALIRQNKGASAQFEVLKKDTAELGVDIGETLLPYLRELVNDTKQVIDTFRGLPKPVKDTTIAIAEISAALGLGLKGVVSFANGLKDIKTVLGGSVMFKGLQTLLKALGTRFAASTLGGLLTTSFGGGSGMMGMTATASGLALGGGVLTAGGVMVGTLGRGIAGEQIDTANQQARGDTVADLSIYINKLAKIRKDYPLTYSTRNDYMNTQETMRRISGSMDRGGIPSAATSTIGDKIAQAAWRKQLTLDRAAYDRQCARLARETVQSITPAFDKIWDRSQNASALTNLARFQKAGLAQKYTPGMSLPSGSMLFSTTMGSGAGHVQIIGEQGRRLDQHGVNNFGLKNFQWFVPPPGVPRVSKTTGSTKPALTDDQIKANQQILDDLYSETHTKYQNERHKAFADYQDAKNDPNVTNKAAAKQLYLAQLKRIDGDESQELSRHHKEVEAEMKRHQEATAAWYRKLRTNSAALEKKSNARSNNFVANNIFAGFPPAMQNFKLGGLLPAITGLDVPAMLATADVKKQSYDAGHNQFDVQRDNVFRDAQKSREDGVDENAIAERTKAQLARIRKDQADYAAQLDAQTAEFHRASMARQGVVDIAYYDGLKAQVKREADDQIKAGASVEAASALLAQRLAAIEQQKADDVRQAEDQKQAYLARTFQITMKQYLAYLETQRATAYFSGNVAQWQAYDEQIRQINQEMAGDAYNVWGNTLRGISGAMGSAVAASIEHWRGFKGFFTSLLSDLKNAFAQAIGSMVTKWATLQLLGTPGSAGGKGAISSVSNLLGSFKTLFKSFNVSMAANIAGIYGAMAALGSMGKKKQRGSLLGGIIGGVAGSFLGGIGAFKGAELGAGLGGMLGFSKGGVVPGVGNHDSVPAMLTPGEVVIPKAMVQGLNVNLGRFSPDRSRLALPGMSGGFGGGGGTVNHVNVNVLHTGDIHGVNDVNSMHDDAGWIIAKRLAAAPTS